MTTDITELAQRVKTEASAIDDTQWYLAKPSEIRSLVEALEKAQKSNEFLKGQLSELANFNPDWDKLEASYESWREIAAELLVAKDRIAELQIVSDKCFLSGLKTGWEYGTNHDAEGYNREISDAQAVIDRAAGIKVIEGE